MQTTMDKLTILADAAKYDVACTSSGVDRRGKAGGLGNAAACGICHTFAADGRCVSLLKVLQSNACAYDCGYCVNRRSNDPTARHVPTARVGRPYDRILPPQLYRRAVLKLGRGGQPRLHLRADDEDADHPSRRVRLWRLHTRKGHTPARPPALISCLGLMADRISVNIELPSRGSLQLLAPEKTPEAILRPMGDIGARIAEHKEALTLYRHAPKFAPAGQSTQMIVGASPESDRQILRLSSALYKKYALKRVFFSAYMPVVGGANLPSLQTKPPLLREHRLYQADWLMRFYGFDAEEILDPTASPI